MKRVIAITATLAVSGAYVVAAAQAPAPPSTPSLAEVAKAEEERRKAVRKPSKVYTNANLAGPDVVTSAAPSTVATIPASTDATPSDPEPTIPGGTAPPAEAADEKNQAYWFGRISQARADLNRTQLFADSLQTRINSLQTDFVNRDNRVEREKIQQDLNTALAELERVKQETEAQIKAIAAIEEEARRAGVPPGWLRPPV
jgi:hypothetical protein